MVAAVTMFAFSSEDVRERFISAEQLMTACDQVWSVDGRAEIRTEHGQPPAGSRVYCKVDHLIGLFDQIRQARNRVVLVSSESDRPITKEFLQRCPPQIAHWYSTNIHAKNEKLSVLPLGLANSYCDITLKAPLIAALSRPYAERSRWLYVNFRPTTNPPAREPVTAPFPQLERRGLGNGPAGRAGLRGLAGRDDIAPFHALSAWQWHRYAQTLGGPLQPDDTCRSCPPLDERVSRSPDSLRRRLPRVNARFSCGGVCAYHLFKVELAKAVSALVARSDRRAGGEA